MKLLEILVLFILSYFFVLGFLFIICWVIKNKKFIEEFKYELGYTILKMFKED